MSAHELQIFLETWDRQAENVAKTLESLPAGGYDFRPDPNGRSIGELAWHLAEIEAYMSHGVERGAFSLTDRPASMERPREIAGLAPGYRRIHGEALDRARKWTGPVLDKEVPFFGGRKLTVRTVLWDALLHHSIHHLGQLVMLVRLAGGTPPGLYGPTREEMAAMRAAAAKPAS